MALAIAQGLQSAGKLKGNGSLELGAMADHVGARASLTTKYKLRQRYSNLFAFASIDAGYVWGASWEARALAGLRIEW